MHPEYNGSLFPEYGTLLLTHCKKNKILDKLVTDYIQLNNEIRQLEDCEEPRFSRKIIVLKLDKLEVKRAIQRIMEAASGGEIC